MPLANDHISSSDLLRPSPAKRKGVCLACGAEEIRRSRRYCSPECRQRMHWVLSLSKGLLKTFNVRYAAFHFTPTHVILDMLPAWSRCVSRFSAKRTPGLKPAEDLKDLVLKAGENWYRMVDNNTSRSWASLSMVSRNHRKGIDPDSIRPHRTAHPKLSRQERACLKVLKLDLKDLSSNGHLLKIRSAYKRLAKLYHPDVGGDAEMFKRLNEAHEYMVQWAGNPRYTSRKALQDSWSYSSATDRWSPPL